MKKMFPRYARNFEINSTNMILDIASKLHKQGYTAIKMVVGSDRVREFETILKKYNGERNRHGFYDFETIKVISAGERDPDAEGVSGMSASKMREMAKNNDFRTFKTGLSDSEASSLFNAVRKGMGITGRNYPLIKASFTEFVKATD